MTLTDDSDIAVPDCGSWLRTRRALRAKRLAASQNARFFSRFRVLHMS